MARALPPASFVREAPTNHQSEVPVTATGHCPVPVRPRRAKTSFPGREAAPLRFASPSAWVRKGSRAGLRSASASAVTLCWRGATPPSWLVRPHSPPTHATGREGGPGNTGNGSPETSEKNRNTGTACEDRLPPLRRWLPCAGLLPLQGPAARRALWELAPGCHNTSPETWTREILEAKMNRLYGPRQSWSFSRRRSRSFRDRDFPGSIRRHASHAVPGQCTLTPHIRPISAYFPGGSSLRASERILVRRLERRSKQRRGAPSGKLRRYISTTC